MPYNFLFRAIISDMGILKNLDGLNEWRKKEAEELSNLVQKRLHYLQVLIIFQYFENHIKILSKFHYW